MFLDTVIWISSDIPAEEIGVICDRLLLLDSF